MTIQEKAIEQLERISSHLSAIGEKEDYTDIAIQALEQQQEWIPVSERLPKESGNYFVTISFDVMGGQEPAREVYKDYFSVLSQKWLYHGEDVIAWMPLPPSYQGE